MSEYDEKLEKLGELRGRILNDPLYNTMVGNYREQVSNAWFNRYGRAFDKFMYNFNKKNKTNFPTRLHNGGIKFSQLMLKYAKYDGESVMFVGDAPFHSTLFTLYAFKDVDLKVSSPSKTSTKPYFERNISHMKKTKYWFDSKTDYDINNKDFINEVAMSEYDWLFSDIGTGDYSTKQINQAKVLQSLYEILHKGGLTLGIKGTIIKAFRLDDPGTLNSVSKIVGLYREANIIKPDGSPTSNDECYIVCRNKRNTPDNSVHMAKIKKQWDVLFNASYYYFNNFDEEPELYFDSENYSIY